MIKLGTKAETLRILQGKLTNGKILPQVFFTVKEWKTGKSEIFWNQCLKEFGDFITVIVRSSALNEDTSKSSQAGKFESIGNVQNEQEFIEAVNSVIASFDNNNDDNQILVQPMLREVMISGVAFTLDPNSMGNYYVINYDESGFTDAITSGYSHKNKLLYVFKGMEKGIQCDYILKLCHALRELEELFGQDNLDVEFAVTRDGELYIFQVRPLCINGQVADYEAQYDVLKRIERKIRQNAAKKPYLCGSRNIYGVMPDWNPAEMIGIRPKALAMSLYEEVITDSVWAYQRDNYGYRNLRSFPLMVDFGGLPYIDIRVSFNSFVPAELDEDISNKLVDYYLSRLVEDPSKHDKVEFDIVFSCYTLDLVDRIQILKKYGFSNDEVCKIVESLRNVTNKVIDSERGLWCKDFEKIERLDERYHTVVNSALSEVEKIYWLLEDCKRYGTLPFAGLARGAFIAVQLLDSMVKTEVISKEDYQDFMNDVETVSTNMNCDFFTMPKKDFLQKYGHLRPGTYDINSLRYDEAPELYFDWTDVPEKMVQDGMSQKVKKFSLSINQMHKLKEILEKSKLDTNILSLMDFIKDVIEGREYGKFIFTRSLSKAIQMIGELGGKYGLSRDDCAYINIQALRGLYASTKDVGKVLNKSAREGKAEYEMTKSLVLSPVILDAGEVWWFYYPDADPNYITLKKTCGQVVELADDISKVDITDKIVLIMCADPGYDWIFAHHIKGFITMYGGANSHMAIRAGELGIPAVVGVGEKQYRKYCKARVLEIDALVKNVRIL
ncbi:MAG: phosphoenolpyruvate synthase [Lachnospiraceae bacterium]|nr:phosphoenolpyruvate synthase [Lachnospiraceae bacterium]